MMHGGTSRPRKSRTAQRFAIRCEPCAGWLANGGTSSAGVSPSWPSGAWCGGDSSVKLCRERDPGDRGGSERLVLAVFAGVFVLALLRHTAALGYLSGRHLLPLVLISVPWAAAGTFVCLRGLGLKLPWSPRTAWATCILASGLVALTLVVYQLRPSHPTRWGHWASGRWLAEHAGPSDLVLDTRGWARFIANAPGYDYWHVRQALTDSHLAYVVVGHEELEAKSPRARTLTALLAYAATPVQDFPVFVSDRNVGRGSTGSTGPSRGRA